MERRKKEKFKVNFAKTERLKNASVITMQNLLNQENNDWTKTMKNGTRMMLMLIVNIVYIVNIVLANYDWQSLNRLYSPHHFK